MKKKQIFGPKSGFSGPKKKFTFQFRPCSSHDRAKLSKEKSTLFPNEYQSFSKFRNFFLEKNGFSARFPLSAKKTCNTQSEPTRCGNASRSFSSLAAVLICSSRQTSSAPSATSRRRSTRRRLRPTLTAVKHEGQSHQALC